MKKNPLISVLLPVYNRERFLRRAIDSVLNQTISDFELIILNDWSTDDSLKIAKEYEQKDNRIRVFSHENMWVWATKNKGVSLARWEWITVLDSDDEYLPDHLEKRLQFLQENPDLDFSYWTMEVIWDPFIPDKNDITKKIPISETSQWATIFIRKTIFNFLGGYKNIYWEDCDLLERAIKSWVVKVLKCPYITYKYYRWHPDSLTTLITQKKV